MAGPARAGPAIARPRLLCILGRLFGESRMAAKLTGAILLTLVVLCAALAATRASAEGLYPYNDLRWRYRLYGIPYPYPYFYQPVCGPELMPYSVGKKLRWRRVYRCH